MTTEISELPEGVMNIVRDNVEGLRAFTAAITQVQLAVNVSASSFLALLEEFREMAKTLEATKDELDEANTEVDNLLLQVEELTTELTVLAEGATE